MIRIGMQAPVGLAEGAEAAAAGLASLADAGVHHVLVPDHVSFYGGGGSDGVVTATALSALHPTLPMYTGIYLLPLRHPVPVARQISTLSEMAPGRLIFGVGIGGEDRHEVEVCGVDPSTRGERMNECLAVLRPLLAGETVSFHGDHIDVDEVAIVPAPPESVPIIIGGRSDAAIVRAGRHGDGWLGIWVSPDRFASGVGTIAAEAEETGRGQVDWQHAMSFWVGFGDDAATGRAIVAEAMEATYQLPFEKFERYTPTGTPEQVADAIRPYIEAGCTTVNLFARGPSPEATTEAAGELGRILNA